MELTTTANEVFSCDVEGAEDAPRGILIIHDWWGTLEYNREWAGRFAAEGYRAMIVDLFDGHHPETTKEASEFVRNLDQEAAGRKLSSALQALHRDGRKLGVLGWSFGGAQAQHAALDNPQYVDAVVMSYCRILFNHKNLAQLTAPVLAIFAEAEKTWPDKQADLELLMTEFDKELECASYDAAHGFANPDSLNYDNEASEESWRTALDFLDRHLV